MQIQLDVSQWLKLFEPHNSVLWACWIVEDEEQVERVCGGGTCFIYAGHDVLFSDGELESVATMRCRYLRFLSLSLSLSEQL